MKKNVNKKNTIIAGGYYGMGNYGDDLFGIVVAEASARYWKDFRMRLSCPRLEGTQSDFLVPDWFPKTTYSSLGYVGKFSRLGFLMHGLRNAEKYVFCGGSVFSSMPSGMRDLVVSRRSKKLQLSAIGISIGPFDSVESEKRIRTMLGEFEYIALRDQASYEIAESFSLNCPIVVAGDLAGMMKTLYPQYSAESRKRRVGKKVIAFSPCFLNDKPELARKYCDAFVSSIKSIHSNLDVKVFLLNLNSHAILGDGPLCNYVASQLSSSDIQFEVLCYSSLGVLKTWQFISSLDAYISVRLHGAISAFLLDVPFALFEYHPKCTDFLDNIGSHNMSRLSSEKGDDFGLKDALNAFMEEKPSTMSTTCEYQRASALNFLKAPWAK